MEIVRILLRSWFVLALLYSGIALCAGQEGSSKPQENSDGFFSGLVISIADDKLVVSREVLGKPAEQHTFRVNPDTKVEGKLKAKARVTVRYTPTDDGDLAIRIIVRDKMDNKKKL